MQEFGWFHKFVYDQHIYTILRKFHSYVDFSFKFHYSCNYIIYNRQNKKYVQVLNTLKRTVENLRCFWQTRNILSQKCENKIIISYYKEFLIMKYSTKLSDTVHVMVLIAINQEKSLSSASIAESVHTNPGFVRQLMLKLKKAGLMTSVAGHARPSLSKPADQITLLDIYKAVEGEKPLLHLDTHTNPDCGIGINIQLSLQGFYDEIQKTAEGKMNTITLQDIINTYYQRTSMQNNLQNII